MHPVLAFSGGDVGFGIFAVVRQSEIPTDVLLIGDTDSGAIGLVRISAKRRQEVAGSWELVEDVSPFCTLAVEETRVGVADHGSNKGEDQESGSEELHCRECGLCGLVW